MRKLIAALILLGAIGAHAQQSNSGILYASDFNQWSLPQGTTPTSGMIQWPSGSMCHVSSNGYSFVAFKVGRPITIVDVNPAQTETVIPVSVNNTGGTCAVTAPMTYTHLSYSVRSGTAGMQEAIDYSASQTGGSLVVLTPAWTTGGGVTGMIAAAYGQTTTSILDERVATLCSYVWSGSVYGAAGCSASGASLTTPFLQTFAGPLAVPQGITAPITGNVAGNVTGNLAGNVTGNVVGNLTGNVTGNVTGHSSLDLPLTGGSLSGTLNAPSVKTAISPVIDITSPVYGALCDGSHDDMAAITLASQQAGTYYAATGIQTTILIPFGATGKCNIADTITYYSGSHFKGSGGTIVNNTTTGYTFANAHPGDGDDAIWFDGVRIVQNTSGSLPGIAYVGGQATLSGGAHSGFKVTDSDIHGAGYAIKVNVANAGDGISHTLDNLVISNNHIYCDLISGAWDTACRDGVNVNGQVTNFHIDGNIVENRNDACVAMTSAGGSDPTAYPGLMATLTPTHGTMSNNVCTNDVAGLDNSGGHDVQEVGNVAINTLPNGGPAIRFIFDFYPTPKDISIIGGKFRSSTNPVDPAVVKLDMLGAGVAGVGYPLCNCAISDADLSGVLYFRGNGIYGNSNRIQDASTLQVAAENNIPANNFVLNNTQWEGSRTLSLTAFNGGITNSYLLSDFYNGTVSSLLLTPAQSGLFPSPPSSQCGQFYDGSTIQNNPACFTDQVTYYFGAQPAVVRTHSVTAGSNLPVEQFNSYVLMNGQLNGTWPSVAIGNTTQGLFVGDNFESGPPGKGEVDFLNTYQTNSSAGDAFSWYANRLSTAPVYLGGLWQDGTWQMAKATVAGDFVLTAQKAASGHECLHVDINGFVTKTGSDCGAGGGGGNATSIQSVPVSATSPTSGQGLLYNGTVWIPTTIAGTGTVTSFAAPSGSWPAWLVPTVTNSTTTPSLAVAASAIPNASLANNSVTFNSTTVALGASGTIPILAYTAPTVNFIPAVSSASGAGTMVNSSLSDTGLVVAGTEPFNQGNHLNMGATGTATSGSGNLGSFTFTQGVSVWNGASATPCSHSLHIFVGTGPTPGTVEDHFGCAGFPNTSFLYGIDPSNVATNILNLNTPKFIMRGATWGTASQLDDWIMQGVQGAGANATSTLTFTHSGTLGNAQVSLPGLVVTGTPLIESGVSTNSDISGEFTFAGATTASYSWANTYASHPECGIEKNFASTVDRWITYTGVASFTINFASAVTGTVSYTCTGRN